MRKITDPILLQRARHNRQVGPKTEELLWAYLRDRRLAGIKFRRQHVIEPFIVDFYAAAHKLIVEIDGSIHDSEEAKIADASRQRKLEYLGHRVIRFNADRVMFQMDAVLREIEGACIQLE